MSLTAAAKELGLSNSQLSRWAQTGKIYSVQFKTKFGVKSQRMFRADDIRQVGQKRKEQP